MNAIEQLKSVLCNHDGRCCIAGSDEDRAIVDRALQTLAQRTWVGLTDDEFERIQLGCRSIPFGKIEAMQQVEAKLKEKNT
jgi:hypothetical protein